MTGSKCEIDVQRTRELSIPELLVLSGKGDENHFFCRLVPEIELRKCPRCGNLTGRNQGKMHRDFLDALRRNDNTAVITISLDFRKSKCEAPGCGCVYYPEMTFASPNARTTRRLDNAIVRMVLRGGCSYAEIADELHGKLSRQAVGNIFHRRVRELNADTGSAPPNGIAVSFRKAPDAFSPRCNYIFRQRIPCFSKAASGQCQPLSVKIRP